MPLVASPGGPPQLYDPICNDLVSNVAIYDLLWTKDYRSVLIGFDHLVPVVSGSFLYCRFSSDGGATFDAGASDYRYEVTKVGNTQGFDQVAAAAQLSLTENSDGISASVDHGFHADLVIAQPFDIKRTIMHGTSGHRGNSSDITSSRFYGLRLAAGKVDAVRFFMSSGNISTGRIWARGILPHGEGA